MKPLSHHINKVKAKPHHIRKRVAFATAFAVAAVIGVVWAGASLATNAFVIKGSSFADSTGADTSAVAATDGTTATSQTAAVANAGSQSSAPSIEIVDAPAAAPAQASASQATVIPF